jgi:Coenzyme PQQ synthesis protein D (PqqD)
MNAAATKRYKPAEGVHARRFDGTVVILDLTGGQYFGLDEVGAAIWEKLVEGRTLDEIVALLVAEYATSDDKIRADVLRIAQELVDAKLLVAEPAEPDRGR